MTDRVNQKISSGSSLWLPSQKGLPLLCLQLHSQTVVFSPTTNDTGSSPVPSCEPSQNGCVIERPHEHHQYSPGGSSGSGGWRSYTTASDMGGSCAKESHSSRIHRLEILTDFVPIRPAAAATAAFGVAIHAIVAGVLRKRARERAKKTTPIAARLAS